MSVFLFLAGLFCMGLIFVWPVRAPPPLNSQYRYWDEDPAWQRFMRQKRWRLIAFGALTVTTCVLFYVATSLFIRDLAADLPPRTDTLPVKSIPGQMLPRQRPWSR